jgi:hypothetical protein
MLPHLDRDRHKPLTTALPEHSKHQIVEINVRPFEAEHVTDPEPQSISSLTLLISAGSSRNAARYLATVDGSALVSKRRAE